MNFISKLAATAVGRVALGVLIFALAGLCYMMGFKEGGDFFLGKGQSYVASPPAIVVTVPPIVAVSETAAE